MCVRQLRYSGMMETARIRRAGYPIRHEYRAFVERYRLLVPRTGPLDQCDCRLLARQICEAALSADADRQFGRTKLFLRDEDDALLEAKRSRVMLKYIVTIQRGIRRVLFRRYMEKYRVAIVTVQRHWRGRADRRRFLTMQRGFHRLGACLVAQRLTTQFTMVRSRMIKLQALSRGYLARKRYGLELQDRRSKHKESQQQLKLLKEQEQLRLQKLEQQRVKQQQAEAEQRLKNKQAEEQRFKEQIAARNALAMAAVQQPKRTKSLKQAEKPQMRQNALPAPTLQARMSLPPPPVMFANVAVVPNGGKMNGNAADSPGYMDVESSKQIVDDVFGFLNDEPDVSGPLGPNVKEKSLIFERQLRLRKEVPTKLLSRPVNYYEAAPRKILDQTRL